MTSYFAWNCAVAMGLGYALGNAFPFIRRHWEKLQGPTGVGVIGWIAYEVWLRNF